MDAQLIMYAVTRKSIPPGQLVIYKALWDAQGWLSQQELADKSHSGNVSSLMGAMRALANRVNQSSEELKQANQGFEVMIEKENRDDTWYYRMTTEMRQVIRSLDELEEVMTLSVDEIREKFANMKDWFVISGAG
jgi:hypothetical protein